jgi:hypothetical protein
VVRFRSTSYELPIIDYRPYRAFSENQSSSIVFQLFGGADVPHGASVITPAGAPVPPLRTMWYLGLRMLFDWRHYY